MPWRILLEKQMPSMVPSRFLSICRMCDSTSICSMWVPWNTCTFCTVLFEHPLAGHGHHNRLKVQRAIINLACLVQIEEKGVLVNLSSICMCNAWMHLNSKWLQNWGSSISSSGIWETYDYVMQGLSIPHPLIAFCHPEEVISHNFYLWCSMEIVQVA